jgi:hypothetical protein
MWTSIRSLGLAVLVLWLLPAPASAEISQFLGTWENVNPSDRGVIRIAIAQQGAAVTVHAWGHCTPSPCDWGQVSAVAYGADVGATLPQQTTAVRAEFNQSFARRQVIVHPAPSNQLRVEVLTQFTDGSNRSNYADSDLFRASTGPLVEDCIPFNPATARAAQVQGRWKLVDGSMWLLDFADKAAEARQAEAIVKHYKLSRQCFVGRPGPSFTYWLVDNRAAAGSMSGDDCVGFNPATVQASSAGGIWRVVDGSHALFSFPNQAEAEKTVQIVKHYGFNQSCFVGRPDPSMSYQHR